MPVCPGAPELLREGRVVHRMAGLPSGSRPNQADRRRRQIDRVAASLGRASTRRRSRAPKSAPPGSGLFSVPEDVAPARAKRQQATPKKSRRYHRQARRAKISGRRPSRRAGAQALRPRQVGRQAAGRFRGRRCGHPNLRLWRAVRSSALARHDCRSRSACGDARRRLSDRRQGNPCMTRQQLGPDRGIRIDAGVAGETVVGRNRCLACRSLAASRPLERARRL